MKTLTISEVEAALARVMDPEIPTASIADLGMIRRVAIADGAVEVDLLPTFAGCPALDVIKEDVERALQHLGAEETRVRFVNDPPWTTARVNERGAAALKEYGISPPLLQIGRPAACPYCGSRHTEEQSSFGPTPCRAVRYCLDCRNPFESFKPKG